MKKNPGRTTHGMKWTTEYRTWCGMKARCYNQNNDAYARYGGRGIIVSNEWKNSFQSFYSDMGPKPVGMTLDRIDNDGDYCKSNCRWATRKIQQNNMRSNVLCDFEGKKIPIATFSQMCKTIKQRVRYMMYDGMSGDQIISHITQIRGRRIKKKITAQIENIFAFRQVSI